MPLQQMGVVVKQVGEADFVGSALIGVGSIDWFRCPLPPNRTCGSPDIRLSGWWSYLRED
jgi:hypothetical protein